MAIFQYPISTRINKAILREVLAILSRNGMEAKYIARQDDVPGYVLVVTKGSKSDVLRCLMQVTEQYRVCLDCGDPVKVIGNGFVHLADEPVRGGSHETGVVRTTNAEIDEGETGTYELPRLRRSRKHRSSKQVVTLIGDIVAKYKELTSGGE